MENDQISVFLYNFIFKDTRVNSFVIKNKIMDEDSVADSASMLRVKIVFNM